MNSQAAYNGWTNYETWNVNLWIDNDQGSHEFWCERAQELCESNDWDKEAAAADMADELEGEHHDRLSELDNIAGTFADLLGAALSSVDWREIAEHFISDIEQPEEGE